MFSGSIEDPICGQNLLTQLTIKSHTTGRKSKKKKSKKRKKHRSTQSKPEIQEKQQMKDQIRRNNSISESHYVDKPLKDECDDSSTRDNIKVLVRIRPKNDEEIEKEARTIVKALDLHTVIFDPKQETVDFFFHGVKQKVYDFKQRPNKDLRFAFDYVFSPLRSNVEIFDSVLKSIVSHVIRGFNCSVFAYGATGSGKTYTMLGSAENPGLTFLMAKELSNRIKEMANEYESEISVSYLEVYNETIKDLLCPTGQLLSIREDGLNGVNIPNLTIHKINDTGDLLRMLSHGNNARTQHPTDHNAESSRSHAVFQVFVTLRQRITDLCLNYKMAKAKLVMVDLAGSERGSCTTNSDCQRYREGSSINKSLLALGNCINALADGKKHIPYRDSKLTRLLKDSLGGNCKTVMIANVAPSIVTYDDTYNTLKYADRAKEIRVSSKTNITLENPGYKQYIKLIGELQNEVVQLKSLLQKERKVNIGGGGGFVETQNIKFGHIISNNSFFGSVTPDIQDPVALENFIQLLSQKKKLEEAHVDASIVAKRSEWKMMWKKWRIESVSVLGKVENTGKQSSIEKLKHQYGNLHADYDRCVEKVQLAKTLVDFNDKEIDLIEKTFLNSLRKDGPFLTVTLREFLYYKTLEREVRTHKCIENFHQQICSNMFDELLRTEIILSDNLKFSQYSSRMLQKNNIPVNETRFKNIVAQIYGTKEKDATKRKSTFPTNDSIQSMLELIKSPIVDYEPSSTLSCNEMHQSQLEGRNIFPENCQVNAKNGRTYSVSTLANSNTGLSNSTSSTESESSGDDENGSKSDSDRISTKKARKSKPLKNSSVENSPRRLCISSGSSIVPVYESGEETRGTVKYAFLSQPPTDAETSTLKISQTKTTSKHNLRIQSSLHYQPYQLENEELSLKRTSVQRNVKRSEEYQNSEFLIPASHLSEPKSGIQKNSCKLISMGTNKSDQRTELKTSGLYERRKQQHDQPISNESEVVTIFKAEKRKPLRPDILPFQKTPALHQVTSTSLESSKNKIIRSQSRGSKSKPQGTHVHCNQLTSPKTFTQSTSPQHPTHPVISSNACPLKNETFESHAPLTFRKQCRDELEMSSGNELQRVGNGSEFSRLTPALSIEEIAPQRLKHTEVDSNYRTSVPLHCTLPQIFEKQHILSNVSKPETNCPKESPRRRIPSPAPEYGEIVINRKSNPQESLNLTPEVSPRSKSRTHHSSNAQSNSINPNQIPNGNLTLQLRMKKYFCENEGLTKTNKEKYYPDESESPLTFEIVKNEIDISHCINYSDDEFLFCDSTQSPPKFNFQREESKIDDIGFDQSESKYQRFKDDDMSPTLWTESHVTGHGTTFTEMATTYKISTPLEESNNQRPKTYKYKTNVRKAAYVPQGQHFFIGRNESTQVNESLEKEETSQEELLEAEVREDLDTGGEGDIEYTEIEHFENLYGEHEKLIIKPPPGYENNKPCLPSSLFFYRKISGDEES